MTKLLIVLLIGLLFEATGVVLLKRGIGEIGDMRGVSATEVARVAKDGVTNRNILLGVFFEALFFGCLLWLMSKADVSFVWPMTALSFVFTTLAAKFILDERVSSVRWIGVLLIMAGATLITWTEKAKPRPADALLSRTTPSTTAH